VRAVVKPFGLRVGICEVDEDGVRRDLTFRRRDIPLDLTLLFAVTEGKVVPFVVVVDVGIMKCYINFVLC
jgi:hypothetical protein